MDNQHSQAVAPDLVTGWADKPDSLLSGGVSLMAQCCNFWLMSYEYNAARQHISLL